VQSGAEAAVHYFNEELFATDLPPMGLSFAYKKKLIDVFYFAAIPASIPW
jgi:hypothetical protein